MFVCKLPGKKNDVINTIYTNMWIMILWTEIN